MTLTKRLQPRLQSIKLANLPGSYNVTHGEIKRASALVIEMGLMNPSEYAVRLQLAEVSCDSQGALWFESGMKDNEGSACRADSGSGVFLNKQVGIFTKQILVGIQSQDYGTKCEKDEDKMFIIVSVKQKESIIKEMIKLDHHGKCLGKSLTHMVPVKFKQVDAA